MILKTTNKNKRTTEQTTGKITEKIPDMNVGVNVDTDISNDALLEEIKEYMDDVNLWHPILRSPSIFFVPNPQYRVLVSNAYTGLAYNVMLTLHVWDMPVYEVECRRVSYNREVVYIPVSERRVVDLRERIGEGKQDTFSNPGAIVYQSLLESSFRYQLAMLMNNLHTGSKDLSSFILDESPYTLIFKDEIERAEFEKKLETFNTPYPSNKEMRRVLDDLRHPIEDLSIDTDLDVETDLHDGLVLEDNLSLEELVDLGDVEIEEMEVGEDNSRDNKAQLTRSLNVEQADEESSPPLSENWSEIFENINCEEQDDCETVKKEAKKKVEKKESNCSSSQTSSLSQFQSTNKPKKVFEGLLPAGNNNDSQTNQLSKAFVSKQKKEFEGLLNPAGVDSFAKKVGEKRDSEVGVDTLRKTISRSSKKNTTNHSQEESTDSVKGREKGGKEC